MKDKKKFVQNVKNILRLKKWKQTLLSHGTKAERLLRRIAKYYANMIIILSPEDRK